MVRGWGSRVARGTAGLAAVTVLVALLPGASDAATAVEEQRPGRARSVARADGFRFETSATYTLDPGALAVHVALDTTITNQREGYYLPSFSVPVLSEATGVRAVKSDGSTLPVSIEPADSERISIADVDLQPDLLYPRSQSFRLSYDLPPEPPRSDSFTRLNAAYATFPVFALGDPGLASVEVIVPDGFEVEIVGDDMSESERDGNQVFTAAAISDPDVWSVQVSARDDEKLIEHVVDVGEEEVNVLGWPDDPDWADFAATQVEDGVPVLEDITGLPWPSSSLKVVETASPYLYGYSGWYVRTDGLIEIGDELDQQVILHELSHLWFNDSLFEGRWINEAFAEEAAALAMADLGEEQPQPEAIRPDDPGRLKLNDWSDPDLQAEISDDQERYGYNTSWGVLDAITDEIGDQRLTDVIRAAESGQVAYRGPDDPEELARVFDWRELLDLLEELGGSEKAAGLFQRHVVSESETADFEARAVAREHYAALLEAGAGWAAPTSVRLAMADWRFDTAEELMVVATDVLATKADLLEVVDDLDVADPLELQSTFESATDLDELSAEADAALSAASSLLDATEAEADGAGPLGAVGLLFAGVDDDLEHARAAFDDGDYDASEAAASDVESTMDGAAMAGVLRLLGLLLISLLGIGAWRLLRRRRARRAEARAQAAAAEAATVEAGSMPGSAAEPFAWSAAPPDPAPPEVRPSEADGAEGVGGATDGGGEAGV